MKRAQDIRQHVQRLWDSGRVLRAALGVEALFPLEIPLGRPTAKQLLEGFGEVRAWKEQIEAGCACKAGPGYRIDYELLNHRQLGRQRLPVRVVFDGLPELAAFLGRQRDLAAFARWNRELRAAQPPALGDWIAANPLKVIEYAELWPRLLAVLAFFQTNPLPRRYLRELVIPGVDTKFIEGQRPLLWELLALTLPPAAQDTAVTGLTRHGFERRFGLNYDEPLIRFRLLDPVLAEGFGGLDDLSIPLSRFQALDPPCGPVFITENKINGLSFPNVSKGLAIFGLGYGVEALGEAPWLKDKAVHYWGDIDTHGLAILSRLRGYLPQTRSLLMDQATLLACRNAWVQEEPGKGFTGELHNLTPEEQALYQALLDHRFGERVRLEQERVPFDWVVAAVASLQAG